MMRSHLYWVLLAFLVVGIFYPVIGFIAVVCMVGPVAMSVSRGRRWCGHVCPRGNFYDRVMAKFSRHRPVPEFFRRRSFRLFMIGFIFLVFGIQMSLAWGNAAEMGNVFVQIILYTTIVGIVLALLYHERTWCAFCPMGSLSAIAAPKQRKAAESNFQVIFIGPSCVGCRLCRRSCPMQLKPDEAGKNAYFVHGDCIKCGKCAEVCPKGALKLVE